MIDSKLEYLMISHPVHFDVRNENVHNVQVHLWKSTKYKYTWYNSVNKGETDFVRSKIRTVLYSGYLIFKWQTP